MTNAERMDATTKRWIIIAFLLLLAAMVTCHFGVHYEIQQIPEEQRKQMTDFDWIGSEWIFCGMEIAALAFFVGAVAGIRQWLRARRLTLN
jgi:di/tricarboxylate transporter